MVLELVEYKPPSRQRADMNRHLSLPLQALPLAVVGALSLLVIHVAPD
jgi:hypothetical protein